MNFTRFGMSLMQTTFAIVAVVALGCGGGETPLPPPPKSPAAIPLSKPAERVEPVATPDAPFRERAPQPGEAVVFRPPAIQEARLKNGIRVLWVERHELPLVSVALVSRVGAGDFAFAPGVATFAGAMLEQGTKRRSAIAISDEYEALGVRHSAYISFDSGVVDVRVLRDKLDAALEILSDVVQNPAFPTAEIERLRARRLSSLQAEKNSPGAMLGNALTASLYGRAHPYGNSLSGREEDLKRIHRAGLEAAYAAVFHPSNIAITVSGDVTKEALLPKLEAQFGAWKGHAKQPTITPPKRALTDAQVVLVDRPNAPQTQVVLAHVGRSFSAKGREAAQVMNAIFGGMFSSRINLNLREQHNYTYGAKSRLSFRHGDGPFTAGGAMYADKTLEAIAELFKEVDRMRAEPPTTEELADAKENLRLSLPGRFESVGDVTDALSELVVYGLPLDDYAQRSARVDAVSAQDVLAAAKDLFRKEGYRLIVVGDRSKLEGKLRELGKGSVEIRDAYGERIP